MGSRRFASIFLNPSLPPTFRLQMSTKKMCYTPQSSNTMLNDPEIRGMVQLVKDEWKRDGIRESLIDMTVMEHFRKISKQDMEKLADVYAYQRKRRQARC